ncbi:hypothetical protein [Clostridium saudiense]|uniref:hypothetical protein n=1 Tax=Clostridium saudiense TaxID=1414720 RepID=UPI0026707B8C|nr:hypothetical protein [Clostridium saudiense]
MIKKVKFINYEEEIYKIFMDQNNLYCSVSNKVLELSSGIEDYCLEYFNNSIWIAFYDKTYRISLIEICLKYNEEIKLKKHFSMETSKYCNSIDLLEMNIKNKEQINLIFRGWNKTKTKALIYNNKIAASNNLRIISDGTSSGSSKPYMVYSYEDMAYILLCEENPNHEYVIYDLLNENITTSFNLANAKNISLITYEQQPILFYSKKVSNNLELKFRNINLDKVDKVLKDEISLDLPKNIKDPIISTFMNKVYVVWKDEKGINTAKSENLKEWNFNLYKNKPISASIIKVINNKAEKINTYFNANIITNYIYSENNNNIQSENNLINISGENTIENKIKYINKISELTRKYNKRYNEYLRRINELNKIIDEKDRLIGELLNKR